MNCLSTQQFDATLPLQESKKDRDGVNENLHYDYYKVLLRKIVGGHAFPVDS